MCSFVPVSKNVLNLLHLPTCFSQPCRKVGEGLAKMKGVDPVRPKVQGRG